MREDSIAYTTYIKWYRYSDIEQTRKKFDRWIERGIIQPLKHRITKEEGMRAYTIRVGSLSFDFEYNGENVGYIEY